MKKSFLILTIIFLFHACKEEKPDNNNTLESLPDKEIMEIAINFAKERLKNAKLTVSGTEVTVSQEGWMYVIDAKNIVHGQIDDNSTEDAIISLSSFKGQYLKIPEHLIMLRSDDSLKLTKVIESEMKILSINNKKIIAEISSISQDSPMAGCNLCKDTVDFQFNGKELIQIK